ncbi:MAG: SCO family protein [Gammaproteobacteria bacterium]|nr:SCO family protein [Gammaproteobacteria bacterium]
MLRILVVALVLLVAAMLLLPRPAGPPPEPANATVLPQRPALPAFALQDTTGEPFTNEDLEGQFSLMFFGFTNCPDVCPITLQILAATLDRLKPSAAEGGAAASEGAPGDAAPPEVVFVSVDPNRDTPAKIRDYVRNFDPSFTGVTASDEALAPLLKALGVTVEKHEHEGENYNVVHNGTVYFIGPRAEWLAVSSPPLEPATLAADFEKIRDWYLRSAGRAQAPSAAGERVAAAAAR